MAAIPRESVSNKELFDGFRKYRILFISTMESHPWGGSEELWSKTALFLNRQGHDVHASVARWDSIPPPIVQMEEQGIRISRRNRGSQRASLPRRAVRKILPFMERHWLHDLLKTINPELVVFSDGAVMLAPELRILTGRMGYSYVNLSQANAEFIWPNDAVAEQLRIAARGARACCFVSSANAVLFQDQIAEELGNVRIVGNPYAVAFNTPMSWPALGIPTFACVGRYEPAAKGQDLLIRVLSRTKWREREFHVHLYGNGPFTDGLQRLVVRYDLKDKVHLMGHVSDVQEIWNNCHALILPSRYEGLPLAVVEAMLCHRPVISTLVAGIPEVVDDGHTGFLAEGNSVDGLDRAMEAAWQRIDDWEAIGREAGRSIRKKVSENPPEVFAEFLVSLLRTQ